MSRERGAKPLPEKSIKEVMESHVDELMAIPGVVGVAIGETEEHAPCIKVMVVEENEILRRKIPSIVEGYPVIIVVTGEIKAMGDSAR